MTSAEKTKLIIDYILSECDKVEDIKRHFCKPKLVLSGRLGKYAESDVFPNASFTITDSKGKEHRCYIIPKGARECRKFINEESVGNMYTAICTETDNCFGTLVHFVTPYSQSAINVCQTVCNRINDANGLSIEPPKLDPDSNEAKISRLPLSIRPLAHGQLSAKDYGKAGLESKRFVSPDDWHEYYKITRDHYPHSTQRKLDFIFGGGDKEDAESILSVKTFYTLESITSQQFRTEINRKVYGLDEVKRSVESAIDSYKRIGKAGMKVLLIGPAGCGKKKVCDEIAKIRNKPVINVPYFSFSSVADISGISPTYHKAASGFLGKSISGAQTTDATFIFESIDKAAHEDDRNGDPDSCLEKILGEGLYFDMFGEVDFDMSFSWIFATAEREDKISHKIKNGFDKIIYLKPYSKEEKFTIAKEYIIPEILEGFTGKSDFFDDDTIKYIVNDFSFDYGCDNLKKFLNDVYSKAIDEKLDVSGEKFSHDEIDDILGKKNLMNNDEAVINKYKKEFFNETDIKIIDGIISNFHKENDHMGVENIAESQLAYIADFIRNCRFPEKFDFEDFMKKVNKTHDGMEEIKLALARIFNKHSKTHKGSNILIVSSPGQGKTTLLRSAAKSYGVDCFKISCNGVTDSNVFKGYDAAVRGSAPGRIISALSKGGPASMILFDEIDKIGTYGAGYAVVSSLLDCLDEKKFSDNYFGGVTFDLSGTVFAATANNIDNIPPELLDRFEVIVMPEYTSEQKHDIFINYTIPAVLRENDALGIIFDDESLDYLFKRSSDSDVRGLYTDARKLIETILLETEEHIITVEDIDRCLGKAKAVKTGIGF